MRARSQAWGPWLLEGGQGFLAEYLILSERESGRQGDRAGRFWAKTGTIWILTKTRAVLPRSGLPSLRIVSKTVLPAPGSQLCRHRARSAARSPRSRPGRQLRPGWDHGRGRRQAGEQRTEGWLLPRFSSHSMKTAPLCPAWKAAAFLLLILFRFQLWQPQPVPLQQTHPSLG